ncbi:MAG: UDP-N-acetylmuramate--L-alanine ligase, partial [Holosporales bacterium]|nr:UDP-N-acetylmuramate--L-alanine ligase [Holosporales bacterium]
MNRTKNFAGSAMKPIHFVGIGGIGMSGIAEVMHNLGYTVKGSDLSRNNNTERLSGLGISISHTHDAHNVHHCGVVVASSAVSHENVEVKEARRLKIPVVKRAEMLAELMKFKYSIAVAGSHGKTTTTSLIGAVLEKAHFDPTIINGGIINSYGTNAKLGRGKWIVAEADESDGTFLKLPVTIVAITNIDYEHLDHFRCIENVRQAFVEFASNIPFYGIAIFCADDQETMNIAKSTYDKRVVTYGFSDQADIRAINVFVDTKGSFFKVRLSDFMKKTFPNSADLDGREIHISLIGRHNVQNSLVALAVALELGVLIKTATEALSNFAGVKRRFTQVGSFNGAKIIDDYGHHPNEIKAVLTAAKEICRGKIYAVIQPHRYTRLHNLWNEFKEALFLADHTFVTSVYSAGENAINGIDSDNLVRSAGVGDLVKDIDELAEKIADKLVPEDFLIFLGAGSITHWA